MALHIYVQNCFLKINILNYMNIAVFQIVYWLSSKEHIKIFLI